MSSDLFKCFCAQLKGCPSSEVTEEVDRMIRVLRLENKRDTAAKDLSGGMKRKLCVGIALIAGSKVSIASCDSFTRSMSRVLVAT